MHLALCQSESVMTNVQILVLNHQPPGHAVAPSTSLRVDLVTANSGHGHGINSLPVLPYLKVL